MRIEISKVGADGSQYVGDEPSSILELEKDRLIKPDGFIHYDLFAQVVSRELIVKGSFTLKAEVECSRCTDFFSTTLQDSSFLRAYEITEGLESVDLTSDIRENILLALPTYPVCSTVCKGLCPQCGKNLNEGSCSCQPSVKDDRWGSLDQLKLE